MSSQLNYDNTARTITWIGAATMNKPISHFNITTPGSFIGNRTQASETVLGAWNIGEDSLRIRIYSAVIPEPEEYALIFALFALGFVLLHRHFQKKRQAQQAVTS